MDYGKKSFCFIEVNLDTHRLEQNDLDVGTYYALMMDNIDEVTDKWLEALDKIEKDKRLVAIAYNRKVKAKCFQVGDLVWKTNLPIGPRVVSLSSGLKVGKDNTKL